MLERVLVSVALIGLGVLAYRVLLSAQRHIADRRSPVSSRPALLIFTSPTCAPCKLQQMPIINRLMNEWRDRIDVRVIDVTEQSEEASRFGVWSLPTTIVLNAAGRVSAINQGVAGERQLREQFERVSETVGSDQ